LQLIYLNQLEPEFPPSELAQIEPEGLLACGGALTPEWLLTAYSQGIFPWFNPNEPILWWAPNPRTVLKPDEVHVSKSLKKLIKKSNWQVRFNHNFKTVMQECAAPRTKDVENDVDTWISDDMLAAYCELHELGYAHSIEVYDGDHADSVLIGGLYGIAMGKLFFGESMFSRASNASKFAFVHLCQHIAKLDYKVVDCQIYSEHLQSLGAFEIEREEFEGLVHMYRGDMQPTHLDFPKTDFNTESV
jgi:leucyl/phenylalanyl-tRNA---protein transferase